MAEISTETSPLLNAEERVIEIAPRKKLPKPAEGREKRTGALKALSNLKPLLPILAGTLRVIDHGAAQVAAQLLNFAGVGGAQPSAAAEELQHKLSEELGEIESSHRELNQQVQDHTLAIQRIEDQVVILRQAIERDTAEQATMAADLRSLGNLVRFACVGLGVLLVVLIVLAALLLARHG